MALHELRIACSKISTIRNWYFSDKKAAFYIFCPKDNGSVFTSLLLRPTHCTFLKTFKIIDVFLIGIKVTTSFRLASKITDDVTATNKLLAKTPFTFEYICVYLCVKKPDLTFLKVKEV